MKGVVEFNNTLYKVDFSKPIDLSLPVKPGGVKAWYVSDPEFKPVIMKGFIGSVGQGGSVNFRDITFNPHGHGTHTECWGHITKEVHPVNEILDHYMMPALVVTVTPEQVGSDQKITPACLKALRNSPEVEALIIRTAPNSSQKPDKNYTETNWPYLTEEAAELIVAQGIQHLLIDLPSVDKENDNGSLVSHKILFGLPNNIRKKQTITETIFVPDFVVDSLYVLNLQLANIQNDAAPSRPVLYAIEKV